MTAELDTLMAQARSGDGTAFDELVAPYRRELQVHCYRMLGSFQDAEDALQDTLLSAWQGLAGFESRSSLRTWLYRIATNRCLNSRRATGRRRAKEWDVPGVEPPTPSSLGEVLWLQPYPDALLEGVLDASPPGPEARYEQNEAVSLAFVTGLQLLPPRQLAVLVLRDVLGFPAAEVAEMLDTTVESVTSALKRARAGLERRRTAPVGTDHELTPGSTEENALAARFASAYEAADIEAVIALLTDDVFTSMPPAPFEYRGREASVAFLKTILDSGRRFRLIPTRANAQPAFGAYVYGPDGACHAAGLFVLEVGTEGISAMTRFEKAVLPWFGLPGTLGDQAAY